MLVSIGQGRDTDSVKMIEAVAFMESKTFLPAICDTFTQV